MNTLPNLARAHQVAVAVARARGRQAREDRVGAPRSTPSLARDGSLLGSRLAALSPASGRQGSPRWPAAALAVSAPRFARWRGYCRSPEPRGRVERACLTSGDNTDRLYYLRLSDTPRKLDGPCLGPENFFQRPPDDCPSLVAPRQRLRPRSCLDTIARHVRSQRQLRAVRRHRGVRRCAYAVNDDRATDRMPCQDVEQR